VVVLAPECVVAAEGSAFVVETARLDDPKEMGRTVLRNAAFFSATHVVVLGFLPFGLTMSLSERKLSFIRLSCVERQGLLFRSQRSFVHRLPRKRIFAGWIELVTSPEERVFLRRSFGIYPAFTGLTLGGTRRAVSDKAPPVLIYADGVSDLTILVDELRTAGISEDDIVVVGPFTTGLSPSVRFKAISLLYPLLSGARVLLAPPELEVVLEATCLSTPVILVTPKNDEPLRRRAEYFAERMKAQVMTPSVRDALQAIIEPPPSADRERTLRHAVASDEETLRAIARKILE
jgi:hypothetical protein